MTSKPCRFPQVRGGSSAEEREGGGGLKGNRVFVCVCVHMCACVRVCVCHCAILSVIPVLIASVPPF